MKRLLFAGFLGGLVAWIWGALIWMALGLHLPAINSFADATAINSALAAADGQGTSGMYWVPGMKHRPEMTEEEQAAAREEWMDEASAGPYAIVYLHPRGVNAHSMHYLWKGLLLEICAATLAAWILSLACAGRSLPYLKRVAVVAGLGAFAAIVAPLLGWNYMHFPINWTLHLVFDHITTWTVAALAIAWRIR
ncbi:MAG: hypothetical protein QF724_09335 [Planctomycetota bacterium]|jgi:hypothetical protein|nr:hypothetical protein [Planctomycetota bacterium]MDP6370351.1 hypothetical protein [Planctomycetota bacterium]MDP6518595.1 hypothetical protein [Planctomycetota bacterium]MDP6839125.1 hypothetical protein [Planctomycetota bacterium]MDP6954697.1 hypothetical protein [Planctomycetota bacterium]